MAEDSDTMAAPDPATWPDPDGGFATWDSQSVKHVEKMAELMFPAPFAFTSGASGGAKGANAVDSTAIRSFATMLKDAAQTVQRLKGVVADARVHPGLFPHAVALQTRSESASGDGRSSSDPMSHTTEFCDTTTKTLLKLAEDLEGVAAAYDRAETDNDARAKELEKLIGTLASDAHGAPSVPTPSTKDAPSSGGTPG